jgi:uncharacterized membrane protein YqiK
MVMVDTFCFVTVVVLLVAGLSQALIFALRYKKVPPDRAMVVYGRRMPSRVNTSYSFLSGGGKFLVPIIEDMMEIDVGVKALSRELDNVKTDPQRGGSKVRIDMICLYKVSTEPSALRVGVEHLMGKSQEDIKRMVEVCIEGAVRTIAYGMSVRDIDLSREDLANKVQTHEGQNLLNMGIEIRALAIVDVKEKGV